MDDFVSKIKYWRGRIKAPLGSETSHTDPFEQSVHRFVPVRCIVRVRLLWPSGPGGRWDWDVNRRRFSVFRFYFAFLGVAEVRFLYMKVIGLSDGQAKSV
jgi:hypothetical protein